MPPGQRLLGMVIHTAHKEGAHRALGKPGGIDGNGSSPSPYPRHAVYDFLQGMLQVGFVEASQEAIDGGVVGNRSQSERSPQLSVLAETDFHLTKGPVLVAHETQDGQPLRLRELVFAKARAIAWHRGLGYIQSHLCKAHQTNFGHGFAAVPPELPAA